MSNNNLDMLKYALAFSSGGGSGGVSSWNDLTDKPFYEEGGLVEVLAECQPPFVEDEEAFFLTENVPVIVVGETYTVNWNGVEYVSTAQNYNGTTVLGNVFIISGGQHGTDTGEPFALMYLDEMCVITPFDSITELTISIYQDTTVIKPLDGKFLPKGTPWIEDGGMVEILPDYIINSEADMAGIPRLGLVEGNTYTVKLQGMEFVCVAWEITHPELGYAVGLGDIYTATEGAMGTAPTGEPFVLMEVTPEAAAQIGVNVVVQPLVEMELPIVFSITGGGATPHKLDNRCLDLAWLPTMTEGAGEVLYEETFSAYAKDGAFIYGTGSGVHLEIISGNTYLVTINGTTYSATAKTVTTDEVITYIGNIYALTDGQVGTPGDEPFCVMDIPSADSTSLFGTIEGASGETEVTYKVQTISSVPNKMPAEFLPDDATSFTLVSPNGTKYAVTVSDDGTLSATAVTE